MLVLLVMIIVKLSNLFFITRDATYKAMLVSVIYIILSGTLEASFSPDSYGTFIILMFVSIGLLFAHPANDVSHPLLSNY
jgi:hypothetical protein